MPFRNLFIYNNKYQHIKKLKKNLFQRYNNLKINSMILKPNLMELLILLKKKMMKMRNLRIIKNYKNILN